MSYLLIGTGAMVAMFLVAEFKVRQITTQGRAAQSAGSLLGQQIQAAREFEEEYQVPSSELPWLEARTSSMSQDRQARQHAWSKWATRRQLFALLAGLSVVVLAIAAMVRYPLG